ncbi:MAG: hypothetical protein V1784_12095 [bacterium]
MIYAGIIHEAVLEAMHRATDAALRKRAWLIMNKEYFELCARHPWLLLRQPALELDFTEDVDNEGMWLPANLFGIQRVRDEEEHVDFIPRDHADAMEGDDEGYRYYTFQGQDHDEFYSKDLTIAPADGGKGTVAFTSADLVAALTDYTGEYACFGTELGFYKMDSSCTFAPRYYGPRYEGQGALRIRPKETQKLMIVDPAEDFLNDRTVKVYWWAAPPPLYRETDVVMLPQARILELKVLKAMPEAKERRPVSQGEIDEALKEAMLLNPDNPRAAKPRDKHNALFSFASSLYTER